ncbi:hypothetical protein ElyMa_003351500 [Elysia marginata]|uniref:DUF4629 domain-containing protein n=1 Tax=Elysia marginata TaxID=1093978 RepID=A0AAV4JGQ1_9GAST|nr:hypothetical protein ElyMa_003351500 [Elysia marginata]
MLPTEPQLAAMSVADEHDDDISDSAELPPPSPDSIKSEPIPGSYSRAGESDVISVISEANSLKSGKSKKRVQFLPEGLMVRVREIPPRSNKSSSESDGSASETSSDSEGSDTESEETSSGSRTPSPAQSVSTTSFTTMPPLVWNPNNAAKGSYAVAKQTTKTVSTVAKITGIHHRPSSPASGSGGATKNSPRRTRRTPSPKLDKRAKKSSPKLAEKATVSVSVKTLDPPVRSKSVRKSSQPRKDGKVSPPTNTHKQAVKGKQSSVNTSNSIKFTATATKVTLASRRVNSAPPVKLIPPKRSVHPPAGSTSVTLLPATQNQTHTSSMDRVGRAMQSLTMGQLYTIDGFIFPSHQAPEVHLPDVMAPYKSEDMGNTPSQSNRLSSPRRSLDYTSVSLSNSNQHNLISPTSATRKKRHAWQMAEGGAQSTLNNTPSIAQLWDHDTPHGGRVLSNGYTHRL